MPVIRISEETMERLKKWAEPLVDTTESAFVKVLNAAETTLDAKVGVVTPKKPEAVLPPDRGKINDKRAEKKFLPDKELRRPLLEVLYQMGGKARRHALRPVLEKRIAPRLQPGDYKPVSTGDPRWWSAASWTRNKLKDEGFLRDDSPRGLWNCPKKEFAKRRLGSQRNRKVSSITCSPCRTPVKTAIYRLSYEGPNRQHAPDIVSCIGEFPGRVARDPRYDRRREEPDMTATDEEYLQIVLDAIRVCADYKPKFGQGPRGGGVTLEQFQQLYKADAFYSWFGLDNPMMYAAHKAAGGMTSVYRQIGIGCETLFRMAIKDSLELSEEDVRWSYEVVLPSGKQRTLYLDGRVPLEKIADKDKRKRFHDWMRESAKMLDVNDRVFESLTGTIFEVRQGYKSKDSKRQNADIANAATAYTKGYFPCAAILSGQIDGDILMRYRAEKWSVVTGTISTRNPLISTYDFMRDVVGYDLAAFFQRNSATLRTEIDTILKALLAPESR